MEKLQLEIEGMSCGHCVTAVTDALKELPGVDVQDVRIGGAEIMYEPSEVSMDQIVLAVEDAGYTAQARA